MCCAPYRPLGERGEEEEDASTRGLTFPEVLHLLTRKAVLGQVGRWTILGQVVV